MSNRNFLTQEAPSARLWGTGITLLDYRPIGGGLYEATRWFTLLFVPLLPGPTWVIRPIQWTPVDIGILVGTSFQFERVTEKKTPLSRILRMYGIGLTLAIPAFGPLAAVLYFFNRLDENTSLAAALVALAIPLGILRYLNRRTEKLYE